MRRLRLYPLAFLAVVFLPLPFVAQEKTQQRLDAVIDALSAVRHFEQVAISPDGKQVAWVQGRRGKDRGGIYVAALDAPDKPRRLIAGEAAAEHEIAWSPD